MQAALLTLSTILNVAAATTYVASIMRGRTKPHKITRFVLFFVLGLNFISILAAHGNLGAELYAGIIFVYGAAFFILSLKRGMGGSTLFDWVCFMIATAGIVGWQVTGNAVLSIWLAAAADFVAYIPAFVKTWHHPHTESPWLYTMGSLGAFLSLVAYRISAVSIFQIATIICGLIMLVCIYHKQLVRRITQA